MKGKEKDAQDHAPQIVLIVRDTVCDVIVDGGVPSDDRSRMGDAAVDPPCSDQQ